MSEIVVKYPDRRRSCTLVTVDKTVEFSDVERRWVSTPIKLYVGRKALEVK